MLQYLRALRELRKERGRQFIFQLILDDCTASGNTPDLNAQSEIVIKIMAKGR